MKIVVCLKQVPDPQSQVRPDSSGRGLDLSESPLVLNESDACALEAALQLVEARSPSEDEVVAIAVGAAEVEETLRRALALGATRAVRLDLGDLGGADAFSRDPFVVVRALAAAIELEQCDLVLTGSQSQDRGHAVVPVALAQRLGWPWSWLAVELELEGEPEKEAGHLTALRELEGGSFELCRLGLPALVAVQSGMNQPRMTSVRGVMAARKKTLEVLGPEELGLKEKEIGASRVEVIELVAPTGGSDIELIAGSPQEAAATLVRRLREERVL